jgi:hypothetical protein
MSEERAEYKVNGKNTAQDAVYHVLREDRLMIAYRPSWREITGSVNATILLQQIKFRWDANGRKPFYKFFQPAPTHRAYHSGDSWTEEIGFTISELRGALSKVGKRLTKEDMDDLRTALKDTFFGYFTDQQHLTWFYFNEKYFNQKITAHYTDFPNQETLSGKSPNQDSLLGEINNPDLAKSTILTSIHTETTTETTKETGDDFLDTSVKGQETGVSEVPSPNPDDQWVQHGSEIAREYVSNTGIKLNQAQKGELGLLTGQEGFDWDVYIEYLSEFASRGGYAYDVKAHCDGYWIYKKTKNIYKAMGRKGQAQQEKTGDHPELNVQEVDGVKVVW